jgi:hypothetical protein
VTSQHHINNNNQAEKRWDIYSPVRATNLMMDPKLSARLEGVKEEEADKGGLLVI